MVYFYHNNQCFILMYRHYIYYLLFFLIIDKIHSPACLPHRSETNSNKWPCCTELYSMKYYRGMNKLRVSLLFLPLTTVHSPQELWGWWMGGSFFALSPIWRAYVGPPDGVVLATWSSADEVLPHAFLFESWLRMYIPLVRVFITFISVRFLYTWTLAHRHFSRKCIFFICLCVDWRFVLYWWLFVYSAYHSRMKAI